MFKGKFSRSVLDYRCTDKLHSHHVSSQAKRKRKNYWTDEAKSSSFPHGERLHWNPVRDVQYPSAIPLEVFPAVRTAHIDHTLSLPCHNRGCIPGTALLSHSPCSKQHSALLKELAGHCHVLSAGQQHSKVGPTVLIRWASIPWEGQKRVFCSSFFMTGLKLSTKIPKKMTLDSPEGQRCIHSLRFFFSCFSLRCRAKNHYHSC